jgi:hypothetical protein
MIVGRVTWVEEWMKCGVMKEVEGRFVVRLRKTTGRSNRRGGIPVRPMQITMRRESVSRRLERLVTGRV